jgi:hypothetical protein
VNLKIDYDPIPFSQGTLDSWCITGKWIRVAIDPGYPLPDHSPYTDSDGLAHLYFFQPDGNRQDPRISTHLMYSSATHVSYNVYQFNYTNYFSTWVEGEFANFMAGQPVAIVPRKGGHCIELRDCVDTLLSNIQIFSSPFCGLLQFDGARTTVQDCKLWRPGDGRIFGTNGDGMRFENMNEGPIIENSIFRYNGDDQIAILPVSSIVRAVENPSNVVVDASKANDVRAGHAVRITAENGQIIGETLVTSVQWTKFDGANRLRLCFADPVSNLVAGATYIKSRQTVCADWICRSNEFTFSRARNLVASSPCGDIHHCVFNNLLNIPLYIYYGTGVSGGSYPESIHIHNNMFNQSATEVSLFIGTAYDNYYDDRAGDGQKINTILIESNTFNNVCNSSAQVAPVVVVDNAEGVSVEQCSFNSFCGYADPLYRNRPNAYNLDDCRVPLITGNIPEACVLLNNASSVTVEGIFLSSSLINAGWSGTAQTELNLTMDDIKIFE